jgi:hypothetical protein
VCANSHSIVLILLLLCTFLFIIFLFFLLSLISFHVTSNLGGFSPKETIYDGVSSNAKLPSPSSTTTHPPSFSSSLSSAHQSNDNDLLLKPLEKSKILPYNLSHKNPLDDTRVGGWNLISLLNISSSFFYPSLMIYLLLFI